LLRTGAPFTRSSSWLILSFDNMKRHLPFIVATVFCMPFLAVLLGYLIALPFGHNCPEFITMPLICAFFWLTAWPVVVGPILGVVSASVVAAWFQRSKSRFEVIALGVYSVVMLLYIGNVAWWHVNGQVLDL
jgi:putative Ca2+/H+ antiporter (TMEM165/GDT1 family)